MASLRKAQAGSSAKRTPIQPAARQAPPDETPPAAAVAAPPTAPDTPLPEAPAPRRARVPLGAPQQRLAVEERPGFQRRWMNDSGNRIAQAREAGYTQVLDANGVPRKLLTGTLKEGGGMWSYLMEIPEEYYLEDMDAKDQRLRQFDKDIRRGAGPGTAPGVDGRYVPDNGAGQTRIKIENSIRR